MPLSFLEIIMSLRDIKHPTIIHCNISDANDTIVSNAGTSYTRVIALNRFNRSNIAFSILVESLKGFNVASETLDMTLQESDLPDGTFSDVSGKSITQIAGNGSFPTLTTIKVNSSSSVSPLLPYVRLKIVVAAQPTNKAVTSFTKAGDVITMAVSDGDNDHFVVGDSVVVSGATTGGNNGTFIITGVNTTLNTITYTNASGASEAGGSAIFKFAASAYGYNTRVVAQTSGA